jgi:signal transduction histidine kinase
MTVIHPVHDSESFPDPMTLDHTADLQTVLAAWHGATVRLEQTHEALRAEVCRLSDELEAKNRELARKNRLADLGQIATHIAHEVRNNMVPVTLYLSLLRRRLAEDSGSLDILAKIESGFVSLDATVNDLLNFTSDRDPQWQTFSLRSVIDEVLLSVRPQLDAQHINAEIDVPKRITVQADHNMIRRATLNLVLNALDAMPHGGDLVITGYDGPCGVELEVADSGPGLTDEARRRAFEPFFSTKSGGTGLGLAIVYRIAEVHGGSIHCTNCAEGGAAFTLRFSRPCAWEAAA